MRLGFVAVLVVVVVVAISPARAETRTAFEFSRAFETCDAGRDLTLEGTSRVVYSWNPNDPAGETSGAEPHGTMRRGSASVNMVGSAPQFEVPEDDLVQFNLSVTRHTVPDRNPLATTLYYCEIFAIPDDRPYHVVQFDMLINPDNFINVHHALIYECPQAEGFEGLADICPSQFVDQNSPWVNGMGSCEGGNVVWGWAVGGGSITLPPFLGYPVGEDGVRYVMLEMHYDLPGGIGLTDDSGIVLTATPTLRDVEAGVLSAGTLVGPTHLAIPPGESAFEHSSWCPGECLAEDIAATTDGRLNLFSVFLHSHLAGREIRVQHVRDGVEQPTIINDRNYDFDYQQYQWFFDDQVELLPNDDLLITCTYNTEDRTRETRGGLGTNEEMCISYFMYYPRLPGSLCWSGSVEERPDTIDLVCNDDFAFVTPPTISTPFEEPDPCPEAEYPHPLHGDATPSPIDADDIDSWRDSFDNMLPLDTTGEGAYNLYWTTHAENGTVRIGIDVASAGWVGFGFSPNGGMIGSDVIMAWVDDDGELFFGDRMAEAEAEPSFDENQDFFGIRGVQYEAEPDDDDAASIHFSIGVLATLAIFAVAAQ